MTTHAITRTDSPVAARLQQIEAGRLRPWAVTCAACARRSRERH